MKTFQNVMTFVLLAFGAMAGLAGCSVHNDSSALRASPFAKKDLYITCRGASFGVDFFGPEGMTAAAIDHVNINKIIGRDATRTITSMSCEKNSMSAPISSDYFTHGCFDNKELDGGIYAVSLKLDSMGARHAVLERVTSRGAQPIAQLDCHVL